ncbi:hypothetical protein F5882DRAFT_407329, partial [Hyaloscypha sp. PMI_1271]
MSGLEIFSVAASVVQVAQLSLSLVTSLTSLYNSIRGAPGIMHARLDQVRTLIEISRQIESQPQLQTPKVATIISTCLRESEGLRARIQDLVTETKDSKLKKLGNTIGGLLMEKKIIGILQRLEEGKTSLILCITQIDS